MSPWIRWCLTALFGPMPAPTPARTPPPPFIPLPVEEKLAVELRIALRGYERRRASITAHRRGGEHTIDCLGRFGLVTYGTIGGLRAGEN